MKLILKISATLLFINSSFAHNINGNELSNSREKIASIHSINNDELTKVYQGEDRTSQKSTVNRNNIAGFTGSGFVDFGGKDSYIEWDEVIISGKEEANFIFRYANGSNVDRSCELFINDVSYGILDFSTVVSGNWAAWGVNEKKVTLAPGTYKVKLVTATNSGGPNFDKMEIVQQSNNDSPVIEEADHIVTLNTELADCAVSKKVNTSVLASAKGNSITKSSFLNSFIIWPNPTNGGTIHLQLKESIEEEVTIAVYGMSGNLVFTETKSNLEKLYAINLKGLFKGVYVVKVISAKQSLESRLIIK